MKFIVKSFYKAITENGYCLFCHQKSVHLLCLFCYKEFEKERILFFENIYHQKLNKNIQVFSVNEYKKYTKYLITKFKFGKSHVAGEFLNKYFLKNLKAQNFFKEIDKTIVTPIHSFRLITRGFNQSFILAKGLKNISNEVKRVKYTKAQSKSHRESRINLHDIFICKKEINCEHLLVIDDVITTKATVFALLDTLKGNISKISIATLAKTF